jgi:hypothetical protein
MFFTFPEDARWNAEQQAVEFGVEIGEYHGVVRVPRCVFQRLLLERPKPERCVEAYHLQRTRFESIAGAINSLNIPSLMATNDELCETNYCIRVRLSPRAHLVLSANLAR